MSALPHPNYITEEEYRDGEELSPIKHEWFQGQVYAMAGGTRNHATICGNVYAAAKTALRGKPCRPLNSEMRVKVEASGLETYPDALIYCPDSRFIGKGESTLLTPKVLFEVLSPSTEKYDRTGKFEQYKQIEPLTDYVLIDQDFIRVEHFRREDEGWLYRSYIRRTDSLQLENVDIEIALDDIYDELELPEPLLGLGNVPEEDEGDHLNGKNSTF